MVRAFCALRRCLFRSFGAVCGAWTPSDGLRTASGSCGLPERSLVAARRTEAPFLPGGAGLLAAKLELFRP